MPTLRHPNSVSEWNAELQHFKYKLPRLYLVFLRWSGFVVESDRNCKSRLIWILFYVLQLVPSAFLVIIFFRRGHAFEKLLVSITSWSAIKPSGIVCDVREKHSRLFYGRCKLIICRCIN
ncbi:hypothetical protein CEXT_655141 [Caerostris extrusa]|uniref:Uncharacterized protein n=1 Tax=Caerostris extrusa TaxID=172846 RepID=A0AAV4R1D0_CAEEX|nr:hypothetical protein CEXT_655141 [Caerostris extrusa]